VSRAAVVLGLAGTTERRRKGSGVGGLGGSNRAEVFFLLPMVLDSC